MLISIWSFCTFLVLAKRLNEVRSRPWITVSLIIRLPLFPSSDSSLAYRRLDLPADAPFELKPSPGKGWGAFATRRIEHGALILREAPLFVIAKRWQDITDEDVLAAVSSLQPMQKRQFACHLHSGSTLRWVFTENEFRVPALQSRPEGQGFFPLLSRFNHSCRPNARVPDLQGETDAMFAIKDIARGEEITSSYRSSFETKLRQERHQSLGFVCICEACAAGTPLQRASGMRRRLIRGLSYLLNGRELDGQAEDLQRSPIIVDPGLKKAAETRSLPLSSMFIYSLMVVFLLDEEGLLDDCRLETWSAALEAASDDFKSERNASFARLGMAQKTWLDKLCVAFHIYGERDASDR